MKVPVLDHGYVELVEPWGSDEAIIAAARMSTQKGFKGWGTAEVPGDEKLLRYLYTHKHTSPFEMAGMCFEVKLPIFVARQWQRHRTFSYNEASARYSELPADFYVPSVERLSNAGQSTTNKQSSTEPVNETFALQWQALIRHWSKDTHTLYADLLGYGLGRELARIILPLNTYTVFRVSGNLNNWLGFFRKRSGADVQWEFREYTRELVRTAGELFPRTMGFYAEESK